MKDLFGNELIRTLGLYQPYAGLIPARQKIETRWVRTERKPPFPLGKYMIYATKEIYTRTEIEAISGEFLPLNQYAYEDACQLTGRALCIADLVEVRDMRKEDEAKSFVKYVGIKKVYVKRIVGSKVEYDEFEIRQVCLVFDNIKVINPFAFKGKQGIGFLTDEQRTKIEFAA